MNTLPTDLRQALRALAAKPGTTATAVALLALAIAACTTVFTVADAVLFNPTPFRDADRLFTAGVARQPGAFPSPYSPPALIRAWRDSAIFEQVEAVDLAGGTIDDGLDPDAVMGAWLTPGALDMTGVRPMLGRVFTLDDALSASPPVIISERIWQSQFGRRGDIIGHRISIDGRQAEVIGVMPARFRFPHGWQVIWRPMTFAGRTENGRTGPMVPIVKVRAGMPKDEAAQRAHEVARTLNPGLVKDPARVQLGPFGGGRAFDEYTVNVVKVLFAGVLLVLLVACVNVANLLLARAMGRRRERAVRAALGASRARLVRQSLLESLLIASAAAGAGLAASSLAVSAFDRLLPEFLMTRAVNAIDFDGRAAALAVALAAVATIASGILPAWFGTRADAAGALKEGDRGASEGKAARRLSSGLIIGEIAAAVALLVGAALMVRSFIGLANADPGIDTRGVVRLWIEMPRYHLADSAQRAALEQQMLERLGALPQVAQVTRSVGLPPDAAFLHFSTIQAEGGNKVEGVEIGGFSVKPDLFALLKIQLISGRLLAADDPPEAVVISDSLARLLWPNDSPLGRIFRIGSDKTPRHVVGVTRDVRTPLLDPRKDMPEYFQPLEAGGSYVLKLRDGSRFDKDALKSVVRSVHPKYLIHELELIDHLYGEQLERPKAAVVVAAAFAAFGMLVCAAGLFGVLSLSVARRRREFGIRLAIGARPAQLSRLIARQTIVTMGAGLVLGAIGALAVARFLASVLADIRVSDAPSWLAVLGIVVLAGSAAAWLPLRDARRTDPLLMLREE